ncbi:MAG TPA: HNH endonuclease signature motif containing protein [Thermoplasmata archaeon]|nr:HNH endonuclease signature motif containing protein [Thermoplasmata archaeon]HTW76892.1 HNH endonuclease signature motif containing protein [Thermoplasmata archaeon]
MEPPLFSVGEVRRRVLLRRGTTSGATWRRAKEIFNGRCAYCRVPGQRLQRDHVIPLSRGGFDSPANVVPACEGCNLSKGDKAVRYWMLSRGYNYSLFVLRWMQLRRSA